MGNFRCFQGMLVLEFMNKEMNYKYKNFNINILFNDYTLNYDSKFNEDIEFIESTESLIIKEKGLDYFYLKITSSENNHLLIHAKVKLKININKDELNLIIWRTSNLEEANLSLLVAEDYLDPNNLSIDYFASSQCSKRKNYSLYNSNFSLPCIGDLYFSNLYSAYCTVGDELLGDQEIFIFEQISKITYIKNLFESHYLYCDGKIFLDFKYPLTATAIK